MITTDLLAPILDGGIHTTNFFNGRVLTAEDLRNEQAANRMGHRQLGQAIGSGIVRGLEVSRGSTGIARPTLKVRPGLAINGRGEALALPDELVEVEIALVRETVAAAGDDAGLFGECAPASPGMVLTGTGAYILVMAPASGYEGRAPMVGPGDGGVARNCGSSFGVEGVVFRLVPVNVADLAGISPLAATLIPAAVTAPDLKGLSLLRNILAHLFLGTRAVMAESQDPFAPAAAGKSHRQTATALDTMYGSGALRSCEVPLALIHWGGEGIDFVDNWSVRRMLRPWFFSEYYPPLSHHGEERLYQFLDHLDDIRNGLADGSVTIRIEEYFRFVPPAAFVPVYSNSFRRGFAFEKLFRTFRVTGRQLAAIRAEKVAMLLRDSFQHDAVDLAGKAGIHDYDVTENHAVPGRAQQIYRFYISLTMHGPLASDCFERTMRETWEAYRYISTTLTGESDASLIPRSTLQRRPHIWNEMFTAIRDVMDIANRGVALGGSLRLESAEIIRAFVHLHTVQRDLATHAITLGTEEDPPPVQVASGQVRLKEWGIRLLAYLDGPAPAGAVAPDLKKAIEQATATGRLQAVCQAQDAINATLRPVQSTTSNVVKGSTINLEIR